MQFKDQVALITGASRGIGRGIALELAREGCVIAFNYHTNESGAESLVNEITALGSKAYKYLVDITDFSSVKEMVGDIRSKCGCIDFLVNNAGITRDVQFVSMKEEDWDNVLNTNLKGAYNSTRCVIYSMMKKKKGRIINITSISGIIGQKGQVNYSSSKAGLIGFTKSLAREIAPLRMTANAVALGFIETDMTATLSENQKRKAIEMIPAGRFGTVEEVSQVVSFLLSDSARYITGQVIVIDGGLAM